MTILGVQVPDIETQEDILFLQLLLKDFNPGGVASGRIRLSNITRGQVDFDNAAEAQDFINKVLPAYL